MLMYTPTQHMRMEPSGYGAPDCLDNNSSFLAYGIDWKFAAWQVATRLCFGTGAATSGMRCQRVYAWRFPPCDFALSLFFVHDGSGFACETA